MKSPSPTLRHIDVIHKLYGNIESAFIEAGAIAPEASELYHSINWRYCRPIERKHKSKIGYVCHHEYIGNNNDRPRVRIVVHSFAHGGETFTFDSIAFERDLNNNFYKPRITVKRPTPAKIAERKAREEADRKRREQLYLDHLEAWKLGSSAIGSHPYVASKKLADNRSLKVAKDKLLLPIENLAGEICAIQTIDSIGSKRIYGKKKGGFIALGDFGAAKRIYFCEGYATADAVFKLVAHAQKRKIPYSVIAALDNKNMEHVVSLFKENFKDKLYTVCPDNDYLKVSEKNLNAGLLSGYNCVLNHHCDIKPIPNHLLEGSDWWDFFNDKPDLAINTFSEKVSVTRFDAAIARIGCFRLKDTSVSLKKACVYALHVGAALYPARLDESVLLERMINAISHTGLSQKDVNRWWYKIKSRLFAQALRAKSINRLQGQGTHIVRVDSLEAAHDKVQELKKEHSKAVFITNAPMGVGKTKHFIQPEFMLSELKGDIPVVITPTKSLTKGVSERFGCSHYIDDGFSVRKSADSFIPDALAITVNSIISNKFQDIFKFSQSIFIDEYTQVLRAITSGTVEETQRKNTESRLASLINNSNYTFIADADFNQIALDQVKEVVGDTREIFIFMLTNQKQQAKAADDHKHSKTPGSDSPSNDRVGRSDESAEFKAHQELPVEYRYYREKDTHFTHKYLISEIESAAAAGKKIYVASDSKKQLDLLATSLKTHQIKFLSVHSDNVNFPKQKAFLDNPNAFLEKEKPQVVLVSPAIQSGVSIEVDYFERCFGIYKGTVAPSVFQQMLHRVRPQKLFELSLPSRLGNSLKESENATAILMGAYQQHMEQFGGVGKITFDPKNKVHTIGTIKISQEGGQLLIEGDDDYARFETLCAQTKALDNQQLHNAANYLLVQAIARGVKITPVDIEIKNSEKDLLKSQYDFNKLITEAEHVKNILDAKVIDAKDYNKKSYSGGTQNTQDYYETLRFDISKDLNKNSEKLNNHDVEFYLEQGTKFVANYQSLLHGVEKAKEHDTEDKNNGVAKVNAKWRESKVRLLNLVFENLGINPLDGVGSYTQDEAKEARKAIKQDEAINRYVTFKLNLNVDSHLSDTAFINKIIKKLLGLKVGRTAIRDEDNRYWVYSIDRLEMLKLLAYHTLKFKQPSMTVEQTLSPEKVIV